MSRSVIRTTRTSTSSFGRAAKAFTLVELLVVIGIIALLISILLPALNSARKQANTIKCAAALREIGKAYMMYANDNKGWWPPTKLLADPSVGYYSLYGTDFGPGPFRTGVPNSGGNGVYWWDFVGKYISTYKINTNNSLQDAALARSSVLWGCTEWQGYGRGFGGSSTSADGIAPLQPGYGMNPNPLKTAQNPNESTTTVITGWEKGGTGTDGGANATPKISDGTFIRANGYKDASQRGLVADAIFWLWATGSAPMYNPATNRTDSGLYQVWTDNATTPASINSWADWYRHGKYPGTIVTFNGTIWDPTKGKVAYNILYCDGHVATSSSKHEVFLCTRMRYPG